VKLRSLQAFVEGVVFQKETSGAARGGVVGPGLGRPTAGEEGEGGRRGRGSTPTEKRGSTDLGGAQSGTTTAIGPWRHRQWGRNEHEPPLLCDRHRRRRR